MCQNVAFTLCKAEASHLPSGAQLEVRLEALQGPEFMLRMLVARAASSNNHRMLTCSWCQRLQQSLANWEQSYLAVRNIMTYS